MGVADVVVVGLGVKLGDSWMDESSQSRLELSCGKRLPLLAFGWVEGPPASMSTRRSRYEYRFGMEMSRRGRDMLPFTKMVSVACNIEAECVGGGHLLQVGVGMQV